MISQTGIVYESKGSLFRLKDNSLEEFELYIPNMGDGKDSFKIVMDKKEL